MDYMIFFKDYGLGRTVGHLGVSFGTVWESIKLSQLK